AVDNDGALVVAEYAIVLTQAPQEDVLVTVVPTAPKNGEQGIGLKLSPSDTPNLRGVTVVFTRDNWFVPQVITVTAPDDGVAEGVREYVIQHSVMQGNSADDGDPYDRLNVPSVVAQVYDSTSPAVAVGETGGSTLVAEGGRTDGTGLQSSDTYVIGLSKA